MNTTVFLFWLALGTVVYTFLGFPILVTLVARLGSRPVAKAPFFPTVTLLIPAYNEASSIAQKIENSLALRYPEDKLDIVVVADGSTDRTVAIARSSGDRVRVLFEPIRRGKIAAVNRAVPLLESEIVIFSDANAFLTADTLIEITANFADTTVAAVAGEKRVLGGGEGLYWRYESYLKRMDSQISSVMGAAGELFAVRRALYQPPEPDSIIEDFIVSMRLVGDGWRVVYEPNAVAQEAPTSSFRADWQRRTRIAAGGFQAIRRLPQLLHPSQGVVAWQYVSHRVLRWAVTPFLLPLLLLLNGLLWKRPFYRLTALAQLLFYMAALVGYRQTKQGKKGGPFYVVFFFCLTNLAALVGFWRYISNRQSVTWQKAR